MPATRTAAKPTSSDTRAPYSRRLTTSRPSVSVPSGWRTLPPSIHIGGVNRESRSLRIGSVGASAGARAASNALATMTSTPTSATPWRPIRPMPRCSGDPSARIDQAVDDVHDQVHDHEDHREDDDRRLDDREIAPGHCLDHQAAETGPREDRLDD